jgi:beta-glucosidase
VTRSMPTGLLPNPETLSLAAKIAQMVVVRTSGHLFDHELAYPQWEADRQTLSHYIQELGIGGVILLGGSAAEVGVKTQDLQSQAMVPLFIAADIEEGVGQRFSGATWFPPPMALAALAEANPTAASQYAAALGGCTAREAAAIGLNWMLAPVVDVNNNARNPVINVRAFGRSAQQVTSLTQSFIWGAQRQGVLTTAKHFPGHGDTTVDSHLTLPVLPHSLERLQSLELMPFQGAIAAGVDAVMTAHVQVPALDPDLPATLSGATLTDLLRQTLGFTGLIITDALIMGAITQTYGPYEAAVLAVEAGADILLMPHDPEGMIRAVEEAVAIGRLAEERIIASVERIWRAKQKIASLLTVPPESCHAWEHVPTPAIDVEALVTSDGPSLCRELLADSMEVHGSVAPCSPETPGDNIVIVDDGIDCRFLSRTAAAVALPAALNYQFKLIDHRGCRQLPNPKYQKPSLLQLFIRGNPFRGSAEGSHLAQQWLHHLMTTQQLQGLVIYGSPYVLEQLRPELADTIPYGFTYGQMPVAQTLLLQQLLQSISASIDLKTSLKTSSFTD